MAFVEIDKLFHPKKLSKYRSIKTVVDGISFDSKKEAATYNDLKWLKQTGLVTSFQLQVPYEITVNDHKICTYKLDFKVVFRNNVTEHWDVKGVKTPVYILKKKLMKAIHNIDIVEI